ncbi:hypothetical protein [Nocardia sp. Marseille-Q1738]
MKPKAIGYLRRDISGRRVRRHELEIRILARTLGYDLARTLVSGPATAAPAEVLAMIGRLGARAVITPALDHLTPSENAITTVCALITLDSDHPP